MNNSTVIFSLMHFIDFIKHQRKMDILSESDMMIPQKIQEKKRLLMRINLDVQNFEEFFRISPQIM